MPGPSRNKGYVTVPDNGDFHTSKKSYTDLSASRTRTKNPYVDAERKNQEKELEMGEGKKNRSENSRVNSSKMSKRSRSAYDNELEDVEIHGCEEEDEVGEALEKDLEEDQDREGHENERDSDDEVDMESDLNAAKSARVKLLFTDQDDDGEDYSRRSSKSNFKKPKKPPAKAPKKKTQKDNDVVRIHKRASPIYRPDGVVVYVNVAKFALKKVTPEILAEAGRADLTDGHYECLVPARDNSHDQFLSVGSSTANLMRHMERHHDIELDALKQLVLHSPKDEIEIRCLALINEWKKPTTDPSTPKAAQKDIRGFLARRASKEQVSAEASAVMWFIDAQIPFAQFDNDLFKRFCLSMGQIQNTQPLLASSKTMVDSILPGLYRHCVDLMLCEMKDWRGFFVTFDGWTRYRRRFISQTYHGISCSTFKYSHFLLDLVNMITPKFTQTLMSVLKIRQEHWTKAMPDLILAGGVADADSKMQAAGKALLEDDCDDMQRCMCHQLQLVWRDVRSSGTCGKDLEALEGVVQFVQSNLTISDALKIYQVANDIEELTVVLGNDTRWEGDLLCLRRAIAMRDSLAQLNTLKAVESFRRQVPDFLTSSFFERLEDYCRVMEPLNLASKLFQTRAFPTGCLVPAVVFALYDELDVCEPEKPHIQDLKLKLQDRMKHRVLWIVQHEVGCPEGACQCHPSLFLRSALLHPGAWAWLKKKKLIDEDLQRRVQEAVIDESLNLCKVPPNLNEADLSKHRTREKVRLKLSMEEYLDGVERLEPEKEFPWTELLKTGSISGESHMEFWRRIACSPPDQNSYMKGLLGVAALLLALPASEAVDESTFSSTGGTLTKFRVTLRAEVIEQMTVVRMFVLSNGISMPKFDEWVENVKNAV